jgi:hypothetical protein
MKISLDCPFNVVLKTMLEAATVLLKLFWKPISKTQKGFRKPLKSHL